MLLCEHFLRFRERKFLAEKIDQREVASLEEVLMSNVFTQEALINLLEAKGIIKKSELLDEIKRLRKEQKK